MKKSAFQTPDTPRTIDLRVPKGWNQCSREQLEQVMSLYLRRLAQQSRYRPYDPVQWKAECFLALAGLEVVSAATDDDGTWIVRRKDTRPWWRRYRSNPDTEPFPLHDWQLLSFVGEHLKWLDTFNGLLVCRWKDMGRAWQWTWLWGIIPLPCLRRIVTSDALLQDFSWQRYRLTDTRISQLIQSWNQQTDDGKVSPRRFREASRQFLRQMFYLDEPVIDRGGRPSYSLTRLPLQLRRLSPAALQVLMVHWQSVQYYLQGQFPRCFKSQKPSKNRRASKVNPLKLYTRSTATLQKYLQKTEDEINAQPYQVILQHLEDMAREAEEMERISRKNKSRR